MTLSGYCQNLSALLDSEHLSFKNNCVNGNKHGLMLSVADM